MEIFLYICLLIVPVISIVSLGMCLDNARRIKAQRKLLQKIIAKSTANKDTEEITSFFLDGE